MIAPYTESSVMLEKSNMIPFLPTPTAVGRAKQLFLLLALSLVCQGSVLGQERAWLETVAESSSFRGTSRSSEVESFLESCAERADHIRLINFGKTVEGRPMTAAVVANPPVDLAKFDDRLRILLLGNIHSGECCGKEALLALLRDLAIQPEHAWLKEAVIVIAPNYNADANDRVGPNHRPGQLGPEMGMGRRENAQQLDLNRDFMKLDSPEARNLVGLIDRINPHLFIDCHTTNGSRHRYCLTYDIPHNPTAPVEVEEFLRQKMMPTVTSQLAAKGKDTFYYGNLNRARDRWTTYGFEPRYSTEYVGLRGRLAILSEAYAYNTFRDRIESTSAFVSACVDYVTHSPDEVRKVLGRSESQFVEAVQRQRSDDRELLLAQGGEIVAFPEKVTILGYEGDQPADFQVEFFGKYFPSKSRQLPFAYLLPQNNSWQADRLRKHGIEVRQITEPVELEVELNQCQTVSRAERPFQKHAMVRYEGETRLERRTIPAGTFLIPVAQPLGRLAGYLLDPESNDGLTTWNFFDDHLAAGTDHPVMAIPKPVSIDAIAVDKIPAAEQLTLEKIYSPESSVDFQSLSSREAITWLPGANRYKRTWTGRQVLVDAPTGAMTPDRQGISSRRLSSMARRIMTDQEWDWQEETDLETAIKLDQILFRPESNEILIPINNQLILFEMNEQTSRLVPNSEAAELPQFSPNGAQVMFVKDNDLMVFDCETETVSTISASDEPQIFNGKLDWVYQEELYGRGNFQAAWWSPDSEWVAFLQLDDRAVSLYPVTDHLPIEGNLELTAYPKAGAKNPRVRVGLYRVESESVTWLPLVEEQQVEPKRPADENDHLVSRVSWSPASKLVYQVQNREQTWLDFRSYDPVEQKGNVFFREETDAWVESPGSPIFLDDGSFLWLSPRTGFQHIYLYSSSGELKRQLTTGKWEVRQMECLDSTQSKIFFSGNLDSPLETHCYSAPLGGGAPQRLTPLGSTHSVSFSESGDYFLDRHSSIHRPVQTDLRTSAGELVRILEPNLADRWSHVNVKEPKFQVVRNQNGLPMDAALITPPDFDPTKKYPVLVYVYSGPQAPVVRNQWRGQTYLWHQLLAQQGYLVWMCDNRSSSYRGIGQAWPIHGNLGELELEDIESGLNWLVKQPFVDESRIGIWGWSYGGYMTSYALTHSSRFRIGISGAPVTDWGNYDSIYTERYMRTPQQNPTGYQSSSVVNAAADLNGKLLLVHGTMDDNVHLSNSIQFIHALQKAGKDFKLMLYPQSRHGVRDPELNFHLRKLMTEFIREHL